jgi:hypothetical protein
LKALKVSKYWSGDAVVVELWRLRGWKLSLVRSATHYPIWCRKPSCYLLTGKVVYPHVGVKYRVFRIPIRGEKIGWRWMYGQNRSWTLSLCGAEMGKEVECEPEVEVLGKPNYPQMIRESKRLVGQRLTVSWDDAEILGPWKKRGHPEGMWDLERFWTNEDDFELGIVVCNWQA